MIARTRPYVNVDNAIKFLKCYQDSDIDRSNSFFLNSGQACLELFLNCFKKNSRVGIQVFTCPTVLDAIKKAGDVPVFIDINKEYFTTTIDYVRSIIDKVDILVLTHVFGIPNPDYYLIKQLCQENKVVLIDDLCQTYHAKINGQFVEEVSDNYFYSFFYDKPISCASGGMLRVSEVLKKKVKRQVELLKQTSSIDGKMKIRRLINTQRLLSPDIYKGECRNGSVIEMLLLSVYPLWANVRTLYKVMNCKLTRIIGRLFPKYDYSSNIRLMSNIQIDYIKLLFDEYRDRTNYLKNYYLIHSLPLPVYLIDANIECSCSQRAIIKREDSRLNNAEVKLYNWPVLLDTEHSYPNAEYVIKNYVNIPIIDISNRY